METVLQRGRWKSTSSMRTYLQAGVAELIESNVPPALMHEARLWVDAWPQALRGLLVDSAPRRSSSRSALR